MRNCVGDQMIVKQYTVDNFGEIIDTFDRILRTEGMPDYTGHITIIDGPSPNPYVLDPGCVLIQMPSGLLHIWSTEGGTSSTFAVPTKCEHCGRVHFDIPCVEVDEN